MLTIEEKKLSKKFDIDYNNYLLKYHWIPENWRQTYNHTFICSHGSFFRILINFVIKQNLHDLLDQNTIFDNTFIEEFTNKIGEPKKYIKNWEVLYNDSNKNM
jgi:hypothetical protein